MHEDLIAPFDFAIEKSPEQINTEKQNLIKTNKPYFKFNESIKEIEKIKLDSLFEKKWQQSIYSNNKYAKDNHYKILNKIINQVYDKGIIQINDKIEAQNDDFELLLIKNNIADEAELADFYTLKTAYIFAETEFQKEKNIDRTFINELLENLLVQNVTFDSKRTLNEQDNNLKNLSLSKGMKYKGQRIISRGDMVDEEKLRWIESLKQEYLEQSGGNENNLYILLGQTLIVSLGVLMIILFLFSF
jgi:membrane-associated HD superfamily phosphohydrolase